MAKACFIEASMRHVVGAKLPLGAIARDLGKRHSGQNIAHMLFRTPASRRWACLEEIVRRKWIGFRDTERNQGRSEQLTRSRRPVAAPTEYTGKSPLLCVKAARIPCDKTRNKLAGCVLNSNQHEAKRSERRECRRHRSYSKSSDRLTPYSRFCHAPKCRMKFPGG